jgi:hypothetical protein
VPGTNPDSLFFSFCSSFGSKLLVLIPIYLFRIGHVCTYRTTGCEPDADTYRWLTRVSREYKLDLYNLTFRHMIPVTCTAGAKQGLSLNPIAVVMLFSSGCCSAVAWYHHCSSLSIV